MKTVARGTFDVKLVPQEQEGPAKEANHGRLSIDKRFEGDIEGISKGEMLSTPAVQGSAGYVALERVTGKVHGRSGSFILQHSGSLKRGKPEMTVNVVADSGTDELEGLTGEMAIRVVDGKHFYDFEYALDAAS